LKCGILKNINEFDAVSNDCKKCYNECRKKRKDELFKNRLTNPIIEKKCTKCESVKDIEEFPVFSNQCKTCLNIYTRQYANKSKQNYLNRVLQRAKYKGKIRTQKGRIQAGEFSITLEDLENLLDKQKGRCYYSKIELCFIKFSNWQTSLERLDPNKGYIIDNIALIASEFQSSSQWTVEKICRIYSFN
jgi:bacterioferritin-associated ferredoxin